MNTKEFLEKRAKLLAKKKAAEKAINIEYTEIVKEFVKDNSPVELFKVYELKENGNKRKGLTRFVPYEFNVEAMFEDCAMIVAWGWWLDKNNVPKKWDSQTVFGVGNPAVLVLSENQEAKPHPDAKDGNQD